MVVEVVAIDLADVIEMEDAVVDLEVKQLLEILILY